MAVKDYKTTADQNTSISGINIAEGCPPSGINNAIRQLMADIKAKTDAMDTATAAAATAAANAKTLADEKLPLEGGTMTGAIRLKGNAILTPEGTKNSYIVIMANDTEGDGSYLALSCAARNTTPGAFRLAARIGDTSTMLQGTPDGALTWGGKNVTIAGDCLPLTGGTMTEPIISKSANYSIRATGDASESSHLWFIGGASYGGGAGLYLAGPNDTYLGNGRLGTVAVGDFALACGTTATQLKTQVLRGSGTTLTWCGNDVLTTASGKAVSAGTADKLGTDTKGGAKQPIYLKSGVPTACTALKEAAYVDVCTTKATTTSSASASNVAVVVTNYVSGNSWYRVWSDGWIEQGGIVTNTASSVEKTVTLKKAFTTTTYTLILQYHGATNGAAGEGANNIVGTRTTTTFKARLDNRDGIYYACGY